MPGEVPDYEAISKELYDALHAQLAEARAENERLKQAAITLMAEHDCEAEVEAERDAAIERGAFLYRWLEQVSPVIQSMDEGLAQAEAREKRLKAELELSTAHVDTAGRRIEWWRRRWGVLLAERDEVIERGVRIWREAQAIEAEWLAALTPTWAPVEGE